MDWDRSSVAVLGAAAVLLSVGFMPAAASNPYVEASRSLQEASCNVAGDSGYNDCLVWSRTESGPGDGIERADAIELGPDSEVVYIAGRSGGQETLANESDVLVAAYEAGSGERLWVTRFDGEQPGFDRPRTLVVGSEGEQVFVTGITWNGEPTGFDQFTAAFDAKTGAVNWQVTNDEHEDNDYGFQVRIDPSGSTVFTSSYTAHPDRPLDIVVRARDAQTGEKLWATQVSSPSHNQDTPAELKVSPNGSELFLFADPGLDNAMVARLDAHTGDVDWLNEISISAGHAVVRAGVLSTEDFRLYGVGATGEPLFGERGFFAFAMDTRDGSIEWIREDRTREETCERPRLVRGNDALLANDGDRLFVTGLSDRQTGRTQMATVALDPLDGSTIWFQRNEGTRTPSGVGIDVEPASGDTIATLGIAGTSADNQYLLIGRNADTGERSWTLRFDRPGTDERPDAFVTDPSSERLYTVGEVETLRDPGDLSTRAYKEPDRLRLEDRGRPQPCPPGPDEPAGDGSRDARALTGLNPDLDLRQRAMAGSAISSPAKPILGDPVQPGLGGFGR